jgi:hypothetical protein
MKIVIATRNLSPSLLGILYGELPFDQKKRNCKYVPVNNLLPCLILPVIWCRAGTCLIYSSVSLTWMYTGTELEHRFTAF